MEILFSILLAIFSCAFFLGSAFALPWIKTNQTKYGGVLNFDDISKRKRPNW